MHRKSVNLGEIRLGGLDKILFIIWLKKNRLLQEIFQFLSSKNKIPGKIQFELWFHSKKDIKLKRICKIIDFSDLEPGL
ncbi:hypothetical protein [Candidatus Lokiarchaeum ossiferum]